MAKGEAEKKPTAAEKGKGRTIEADGADRADNKKELKKDKDGNVVKDDRGEEELSEEDQQLKGELDMLVERLQEPDVSLYRPAVEAIGNFMKTSTSSMTAVPKPLKFLRPHYKTLERMYQEWGASNKKVPKAEKHSLADVLSVLGMTQPDEDKLDSLKYRILAPSAAIGKDAMASWGHEYMRHLALELGQQYQRDVNAEEPEQDEAQLSALARELVPYFLKHNAEADAVDLMSELEMIDEIGDYVDENNYERVCGYMISMVPLLISPYNDELLRIAHDIYKKYNRLSQAMSVAIRLNDMDIIKEDLFSTEDQSLRRQMAFQIARQRISLELPDEIEDEALAESLNNTRLHQHFKSLGKELNILDPKSTQDIYKTHLESSRTAGMTNVDSARHNLASALVNGFVNAGFGSDKMMLVDNDNQTGSWVWKTKDDGKISTAASIGLLQQWDLDDGLQTVDGYSNSNDDLVKAGAMLSVGVLNSGVREPSEPAMALLMTPEILNHKTKEVRIAAIMGLGLAYAGTQKEELVETLLPYVGDSSLEMQLSAMAALSLGMIFVGSANSDIGSQIVDTFFNEEREKQLKDKWMRFMALGLALLFFGRQEEVDVILETLEAVDHPMSKPSAILCQVCACAGTGTVLKLQDMLHICYEHIDPEADKERDGENSGEESASKEGDNPGKKIVDPLLQSYAVLGLGLVAMGEDVGQDMILRQFGHLMHYGESNIRRAVPLAMGLVSASNPQMKVYDTLSRYTHDNDNDVAVNAIFAMGLVGAGTNNARLAQLLRQLASYYSRDPSSLFMVRIAQGLLHMGKGTMTVNPFHTDRTTMSRVAAAGLLTVLVALIDAKTFILDTHHYLLYFLAPAMSPRFIVTLDEELNPLKVNVRVGQAVDTVGQAGRPKTITGWQTQSTPVVLGYGERAELEDEKYLPLNSVLEGVVLLRKNPDWED